MTPDDAAQVTVLQRCCWVDEAMADDTLEIGALRESPEQVGEWLATWNATGLWRARRLLGMVRARRVDADWHVGRLGVAPDQRGQGLGRCLLRDAEATADPGCRRIVLFTGAESKQNIALYQSDGPDQREHSASIPLPVMSAPREDCARRGRLPRPRAAYLSISSAIFSSMQSASRISKTVYS
jgi:GNAT superfamily N-acetyltransferase